jgi:fructoselysine-6-P-deglycase FrlB-like protein
MSKNVHDEIASQPACWREAERIAPRLRDTLTPGARVAFLGCGTSYYVAQACARLREDAGAGESDAFTPTEAPPARRYDAVVAISRSGTTSELLWALPEDVPTVAIAGSAGTPLATASRVCIALPFADERAVVQTRFATSVVALFRAAYGGEAGLAASDAETALDAPLPVDSDAVDHYVFLGRGWRAPVAAEAALKLREAGRAWAESYPSFEYRHGPIAAAGERTAVWSLDVAPPGLAAAVRSTAASFVELPLDPLAQLVLAQRLAVEVGERKDLDPDAPRHLTRSVVLANDT